MYGEIGCEVLYNDEMFIGHQYEASCHIESAYDVILFGWRFGFGPNEIGVLEIKRRQIGRKISISADQHR